MRAHCASARGSSRRAAARPDARPDRSRERGAVAMQHGPGGDHLGIRSACRVMRRWKSRQCRWSIPSWGRCKIDALHIDVILLYRLIRNSRFWADRNSKLTIGAFSFHFKFLRRSSVRPSMMLRLLRYSVAVPNELASTALVPTLYQSRLPRPQSNVRLGDA